jgi:hypothetical protein
MTPLPLLVLEAGSGTKFLTNSANLTLWTHFGSHKELGGASPNGSCEPILDIYIPKTFQWYKELFNPMGFDPCNCSLKIWEFIGTPTPKMGAHLGMWGFIPSHSFAFPRPWNVTFGLPSWLAPFASPCLGREPKARVVTYCVHNLSCLLVNKKQIKVELVPINDNGWRVYEWWKF